MNDTLNLSPRLKKIATLITSGSNFIDVGSDHAYLPCYVCAQDASVQAIASEVSEGPYLNGTTNVEKNGLSAQVDIRLGDGLSVIHQEDDVDTIVVAGMGGQLIKNILQNGEKKLSPVDKIIVQPNTNAPLIRQYLNDIAYHLISEYIVEDHGILYEILVAVSTAESPYHADEGIRERQFYFGPFLMKSKSVHFIQKWKQEYEHLKRIRLQMERANVKDEQKLEAITGKLRWIEEVIS